MGPGKRQPLWESQSHAEYAENWWLPPGERKKHRAQARQEQKLAEETARQQARTRAWNEDAEQAQEAPSRKKKNKGKGHKLRSKQRPSQKKRRQWAAEAPWKAHSAVGDQPAGSAAPGGEEEDDWGTWAGHGRPGSQAAASAEPAAAPEAETALPHHLSTGADVETVELFDFAAFNSDYSRRPPPEQSEQP